jgi:hypothetical protein
MVTGHLLNGQDAYLEANSNSHHVVDFWSVAESSSSDILLESNSEERAGFFRFSK